MSKDYFEGVEIATVEAEVESPADVEEVAAAPEPEAEVEEAVEDTDENPDDAEDAGDEPFPKKAVNAISKRDRKIHNLRKEREDLHGEIAKLKEAQEKSKESADEPPQEEEFDTYTEFLEARQEYIAKKTLKQSESDKDQDRLNTLEQQQTQKWYDERAEVIESKEEELRSTHSDYDEVVDANMDRAIAFATQRPDLYESFVALDNPTKAFYNLAKEGKLESIMQMPSNIAVVELVQAQYRGNEPVKAAKPEQTEKPVSAAPPPINSAKGSATSQTPLHKLSADDLYERLMG